MRLMLDLALSYGNGPVFLKDIARQQDISEKYLSQIIIPLKSRGLVNSFRGAHGGYVLARHPSQITVQEIMEVLEGEMCFVKCVRDPSVCKRVSLCVTRQVWGILGDAVSRTLESMNLEDLVSMHREKAKAVAMYNI